MFVSSTAIAKIPLPTEQMKFAYGDRSLKLERLDLAEIASRTIEHYDKQADQFWKGTCNHDVSQNIEALLQHIQGQPPYCILYFGCGPGRDLKTLRDLGHFAIGLDGASHFVRMARAHSGCEVWQQEFFNLALPDEHFDGVFANASLFHVPKAVLARVLSQLRASLKKEGVLFSSNPRGSNEEGWLAGRYGVFHDIDSWRTYLVAAGFVELTHYYRPLGLPREQQPWLASVWRRSD